MLGREKMTSERMSGQREEEERAAVKSRGIQHCDVVRELGEFGIC